ncbi:transposase [Streptomyces sp. NBC_01590]
MRRCRYRGQPKAHLQHVLTAIAVNIERLSSRSATEEPSAPRPPTPSRPSWTRTRSLGQSPGEPSAAEPDCPRSPTESSLRRRRDRPDSQILRELDVGEGRVGIAVGAWRLRSVLGREAELPGVLDVERSVLLQCLRDHPLVRLERGVGVDVVRAVQPDELPLAPAALLRAIASNRRENILAVVVWGAEAQGVIDAAGLPVRAGDHSGEAGQAAAGGLACDGDR